MMNRDTLYELRRITAEHPYYQTARLLLLKNLYLLHDSSFDEELRRSAIYFTDRRVLFNLVEAAHYRLKHKSPQSFTTPPDRRTLETPNNDDSRTVTLIDSFLDTLPEDKTDNETHHRKPTAVDATTDYVAYLLATDFEELENNNDNGAQRDELQENNGNENGDTSGSTSLIDAFIENDGKITLQEELEYTPEIDSYDNPNDSENYDDMPDDEFLTETLASIYIKQGRYKKALDIMERVNEKSSKKNKYYDDQKRFLELLIANS